VKYAGVTILGATALISTVLSMLYVTAAGALVQPQLKRNTQQRVMQGMFHSPWKHVKF
jgi:hypothetical protein